MTNDTFSPNGITPQELEKKLNQINKNYVFKARPFENGKPDCIYLEKVEIYIQSNSHWYLLFSLNSFWNCECWEWYVSTSDSDINSFGLYSLDIYIQALKIAKQFIPQIF